MRKSMQKILDTFGGTNGGGSFVNLKSLIEDLEYQNDQSALAVLDIVDKFAKLIDIANSDIPKVKLKKG
jgi:hypothetical protein